MDALVPSIVTLLLFAAAAVLQHSIERPGLGLFGWGLVATACMIARYGRTRPPRDPRGSSDPG